MMMTLGLAAAAAFASKGIAISGRRAISRRKQRRRLMAHMQFDPGEGLPATANAPSTERGWHFRFRAGAALLSKSTSRSLASIRGSRGLALRVCAALLSCAHEIRTPFCCIYADSRGQCQLLL